MRSTLIRFANSDLSAANWVDERLVSLSKEQSLAQASSSVIGNAFPYSGTAIPQQIIVRSQASLQEIRVLSSKFLPDMIEAWVSREWANSHVSSSIVVRFGNGVAISDVHGSREGLNMNEMFQPPGSPASQISNEDRVQALEALVRRHCDWLESHLIWLAGLAGSYLHADLRGAWVLLISATSL